MMVESIEMAVLFCRIVYHDLVNTCMIHSYIVTSCSEPATDCTVKKHAAVAIQLNAEY